MSLVVAVAVAVILFIVALLSPELLPSGLRAAHPWLPQVIVKTVLVVGSLALMFMSRRPLTEFGFRRANSSAPRSRWMILAAMGVGALTSMIILGSGLRGLAGLLKGVTFPQIILTIWIYSSVTEEIFTRAWFQSAIADKVSRRTELLLSAALFGAMHISLFFAEVEAASAAIIVVCTSILGYICATLRARTGSVLPAIWAHIAFNVGGMFGGIIATVARMVLKS